MTFDLACDRDTFYEGDLLYRLSLFCESDLSHDLVYDGGDTKMNYFTAATYFTDDFLATNHRRRGAQDAAIRVLWAEVGRLRSREERRAALKLQACESLHAGVLDCAL